jgi:hypothetical protein
VGGRASQQGYPLAPHDWDAFRLRPQCVPVDPTFRNTLGRRGGRTSRRRALEPRRVWRNTRLARHRGP